MQSNHVIINTQADWDIVLKNPKPVIVEFQADWCKLCKILQPKLIDAARFNGGKWVLAIVNIENAELKDISQTFAFFKKHGLPAVYLFRDGKETMKFIGNQTELAEDMIASASF